MGILLWFVIRRCHFCDSTTNPHATPFSPPFFLPLWLKFALMEAVLAEFHNRSIVLQETPEKLPGLRDQKRELERRLAQVITEKNQIIANLQATVTLLAQQIQALTLENERLRTSAARLVDNVTELPRR
ncbi:MAG: hypothetical protein ACRDHZ_17815 [Ktedonobacteraceae bacterium]